MSEVVHQHRATSWAELLEESDHPRVCSFLLGEDPGDKSPVVMRASFPPGYVVGPHSHESDYAEIILEGSQQVTRRWYHAGDIRMVKGGTVYGPLEAGPDGAVVLIIFKDGRTDRVPPRPGAGLWVEPTTGDRRYAEAPDSEPSIEPAPDR